MSAANLLDKYQHQPVPQSYNAGFVALSCVVSLIGAASTLELISRRTGSKGLFNQVLLVSSAVTMGGISIWCMHFIGNTAIIMANGETELQIQFSSGFTAVSFFVPIVVLLAAFVAVGTNNAVSWRRVAAGGVLCGVAICGMHYLGNASISNYVCIYQPAYIVGAAIISIIASTIALAIFFIFRAMWVTSWRKRTISAVVLASAVSGMHWCAAVGTRYRLIHIKSKDNKLSRSATVIVVICLSLGASAIMAGLAILRANNMRKSALRAQQITLAAAVFDKDGRILVDPDGLIPSTVMADSFLEKNTKEGFTTAHPLFHWMFQASRNWGGISRLIDGMSHHLTQLSDPGSHGKGRHGIQLMNEHGEIIEGYDVVFRELFCLAAAALSHRLHEDLASVGLLWDEILPTGSGPKRAHERADVESGFDWQQGYARGSLIVLVRRVNSDSEAERLISSGHCFADLRQVCDIIRCSMQIQSADFEAKLRDMASYATEQDRVPPGVHLGFFAIRPRVKLGFEVLVRKGSRHVLPSTALPMERFEPWQAEFLKHFQDLTVVKLLQRLGDSASNRSPRETEFAMQLSDAIESLREFVQEPFFEDATFSPTIVRLHSRQAETFMIALRLVVPIHSVPSGPNCELATLGFFKMRQVAERFQQGFMEDVHREFWPIIKATGTHTDGSQDRQSGLLPKLRRFGSSETSRYSDSVQTSSTVNFCSPDGGKRSQSIGTIDDTESNASREKIQQSPPSYGGIMVSQEITIKVEGGHSDANACHEPPEVQSAGITNAASKTSGIQLRPMDHIGTNIQAGSWGETDNHKMGAIVSFVDIFLAECMKGR
ncbi:hypothetical protein BGZ61DRAFT_594901 [Ilyonectria robusta]|uniref:uncharacterized protein n=1 Tax=Ilyonectria robusta TaxID=1079257 RepID=UPI001E8D7BD4|nr:uncharacterized protein BGZ61DRAFT_594901 [Ilyonectria robusta]KAH8652905.1 hypothetical protein BGZ61DRAFT_594901 [Ilyonectria robusta]